MHSRETGSGFAVNAADGHVERSGIAENDVPDGIALTPSGELAPEPALELPAVSRRGRKIQPSR